MYYTRANWRRNAATQPNNHSENAAGTSTSRKRQKRQTPSQEGFRSQARQKRTISPQAFCELRHHRTPNPNPESGPGNAANTGKKVTKHTKEKDA